MNKHKKLAINLILFFCSLLFSVFLSEIIVRIFVPVKKPHLIVKKKSPPSAKKELDFLRPYYEAILTSSEYTMEIKLNSEGFRDIEHKKTKSQGVFRILAVGDSFTYGMGVGADHAYPQVLERLLNSKPGAKGTKFEVFNLGLPGIGTFQETEIIKYGMGYSPDLILLGILVENRWNSGNGNDLCDNLSYLEKSMKEKGVAEKFITPRSNLRSKFINFLNAIQHLLSRYSKLYFVIMTKKGTALRNFFIKFRENKNQAKLDMGWEVTKKALIRINEITKSRKVPIVIIYIPFLYDVHNQKHETSKILADFSTRKNIFLCDLLSTLGEHDVNDLYYLADGHWKPAAHKITAQALKDFLVGNNIISLK